MSEWISVKERLPGNSMPVITGYSFTGLRGYGHYDSNVGWVDRIHTYMDEESITHWQPLPPPPASAGKEQ